jgi:KUP system potassium uptake protein
VHGIAEHSEILKALSPTYALGFFVDHFSIAFSRWPRSCSR